MDHIYVTYMRHMISCQPCSYMSILYVDRIYRIYVFYDDIYGHIWGHIWQLIFHKEHICSHICLHIWNMYDIYWHTCSEYCRLYVSYMFVPYGSLLEKSSSNSSSFSRPSWSSKSSFTLHYTTGLSIRETVVCVAMDSIMTGGSKMAPMSADQSERQEIEFTLR